MTLRLQGDFNGLFGDLLCLSHSDNATREDGAQIELREGMDVVAFEKDVDDRGDPAFLVARGKTILSPVELQHAGSRWCLRVDEQGVRHVATVRRRLRPVGQGRADSDSTRTPK